MTILYSKAINTGSELLSCLKI